MASGAAPCSEQRPSAGQKEKGRGRRKTSATAGMIYMLPGSGGGIGSGHHGHCEMCVVCGDRACNHHYYGVAACHGCKCFFWRSIKNKMKYICRGEGHCEINPNHRNACRFCRLQRCLKAGMQPESVRMPKVMTEENTVLEKLTKDFGGRVGEKQHQIEQTLNGKEGGGEGIIPHNGHCPFCHRQNPDGYEGREEDDKRKPMMEEGRGGGGKQEEIAGQQQIEGNKTMNMPPITATTQEQQNQAKKKGSALMGEKEIRNIDKMMLLVKKLVEIEMSINEVVDFSENEAPKRQLQLDSLFDYPEFLDRFRTQVNYCVRLRRVTEEDMEFCKYRTLTKVVDYIRALSFLNPEDPMGPSQTNGNDPLTVHDKIVLLCHGFAPLALFDIASGTSFATKDTQNLLCLPTGLTLCAGEPMVPNSFLSQQIVSRCIGSLVRLLSELQLDQEEFVMMKLIIALALVDTTNEDNEQEDNQPGEGDNQGIPMPTNTSLLATFCPSSHSIGQATGHLLSPSARQFVEKLRDQTHAALYQHSPRGGNCGSSSSSELSCSSSFVASSSSSSDAALRFAKLLHILPKLTLLSRDLVEHIRMVHTFPSTTRPTDPLFYQLFGDIFRDNRHQNRLSFAPFDENPFSNSDYSNSPFESFQHQKPIERREASRFGFDAHAHHFAREMGSIFGGEQFSGSHTEANQKTILPPYKVEYGVSPKHQHSMAKSSPIFPPSLSQHWSNWETDGQNEYGNYFPLISSADTTNENNGIDSSCD